MIYRSFFRSFFISLLMLFPLTVAAQIEADFSEEGLSDTDLTTDLEAEALPTTDPVAFWWEQIRGNAISLFTFNAERKAEQYRLRLHILDRKLAACSEIGDDECVTRIEERLAALKDRTEKHIARREELKEQFQERFAAWRARREARIVELREKAVERKSLREDLREERQSHREEARERRRNVMQQRQQTLQRIREDRRDVRQDQRDQRQELRQEQRSERQDVRQRNREELIQLRSQNARDRLDATRDRVQQRQEATTKATE
jgi:hypothetical protein